ncbi:MAG: nitronate monooxygenase [Nibricoccus sp.]
MAHPRIIQGGMGVAVSGWALARAVSQAGQLGVVSGTALAHTLTRRLQLGDADGKLRHALEHLPIPGLANRILKNYFVPGGKKSAEPFKSVPMPAVAASDAYNELSIAANFTEVFLAKEGHDGVVGINMLEKIQFNTLHSIWGAMLAGVDYVLMGAGIPRSIPGTLDNFAAGLPAEIKVDDTGAADNSFVQRLDPSSFLGGRTLSLKRPFFFAIVASATLALTLAKKSTGEVNGFVVETETAGGHNAPPRGPLQLTASGEPLYGARDIPDLEKIRAIGLPFWIAGSCGAPGKLAEALRCGASGIQVGTAFAFCRESGIEPELKRRVLELSRAGQACVFTDPAASPTGFPFKVVQVDGTLSSSAEYASRARICDLGYLRHAYGRPDGSVGYRCPSEPVQAYVDKGGMLSDTVNRKCLCNGLMAAAGLAQKQSDGSDEPPIITAGNEIAHIGRFVSEGADSYSAADVIAVLLT